MWRRVAWGTLLAALLVCGRPADDGDDGPISLNPTSTGVGSVKCSLSDGRSGWCVPYHQCYSNFSIIKYAEPDDLEIRLGQCPSHRQWCCANDIVTPEELDQRNPITATADTGGTSSIRPGSSTTGTAAGNTTGDTAAEYQGCGTGLADGHCPWCVAIFRVGGNPRWTRPGGYFCAGALVHPRLVVTPAHCLQAAKGSRMWVRLGARNISSADEPNAQQVDVARASTHPNYNSGTKSWDVGVLELAAEAKVTPHVRPACLVQEGAALPATGCRAAAWGRRADGRYPDTLEQMEVSAVDNAECTRAYVNNGASAQFAVDESSACAATPGRDSCPLQHGAPLFCPVTSDKGNTRWSLHGVQAWSLSCGPGGTPAVFASASAPAAARFLRNQLRLIGET